MSLCAQPPSCGPHAFEGCNGKMLHHTPMLSSRVSHLTNCRNSDSFKRGSAQQSRRLSIRTQALFNFARKQAPKKVARETVVPEPSYNIPLVLAGITGLSAYEGNVVLAGLSGILGAFLAIQASRVKFVFRDDSLEVVLGEQQEETQNAFVGGENRWSFDTFVNWEFWWPGFPVLVYFKETQTKPEGQIHFFPIIFNSKQLYNVMVERCGTSQNSGPK